MSVLIHFARKVKKSWKFQKNKVFFCDFWWFFIISRKSIQTHFSTFLRSFLQIGIEVKFLQKMNFFGPKHAYNKWPKNYFCVIWVQSAFVNIQKCGYFVKKLQKNKISRKYISTKIKIMIFLSKVSFKSYFYSITLRMRMHNNFHFYFLAEKSSSYA